MPYQEIEIARLEVNPANDRHGELANETAAIAELFRLREQHMRRLAADIRDEGKIYDPPLVFPDNNRFIVYDGNRRVACIKLILNPERAPSQDLQVYFRQLRDSWDGNLPESIECQIEVDREIIDNIVYRRHTGSQGGVGQSDWDDRAKHNFIERTGRGGRLDVAVEIEELLRAEERLPNVAIPRSTLNRLLSSEIFRNRVGISTQGNRFGITHERDVVLASLERIASDLAARRVVLGDLWNNAGKTAYLNRLEVEGLLPTEEHVLAAPEGGGPRVPPRRRGRPPIRRQAPTLIPNDEQEIPWRADQARIRAIWNELQSLSLAQYPNAVSALLRILIDLTAEAILERAARPLGQGLSENFSRSIRYLAELDLIDRAYFEELDRMRLNTEIISIRSMQRYVHSQTFAPLPDELETYWTRLRSYLIVCLTH